MGNLLEKSEDFPDQSFLPTPNTQAHACARTHTHTHFGQGILGFYRNYTVTEFIELY